MHGLQAVNAMLRFVRQVVVSGVHIDVLRVAAAPGQLDCEQHRRLGWARVVGMVGVERFARDDAPAVLDLVVGNVVHAGMTGNVPLLLVMGLDLAEQLRRCLELVRRKVLVAHRQNMMFGEGTA
jgi:hypothetical protein